MEKTERPLDGILRVNNGVVFYKEWQVPREFLVELLLACDWLRKKELRFTINKKNGFNSCYQCQENIKYYLPVKVFSTGRMKSWRCFCFRCLVNWAFKDLTVAMLVHKEGRQVA